MDGAILRLWLFCAVLVLAAGIIEAHVVPYFTGGR